MAVFGAPNHVLEDEVIVGPLQVLVGHILEFCESLELVRRDEVVGLLARQILKDLLCLAVHVKLFILFAVLRRRKYKSQIA